MIRALLLDLDNTLLKNDMESFLPAYLQALGEHVAPLCSPKPFIHHLMRATDAMIADNHPTQTNAEAFNAAFFPAIGRTLQELEPLFDAFYAQRFPELRSLTRPDPAARPLLEWAFANGFQVAIATNPLFPRTAIEQRLEWAGVPVTDFPYDLVTSYEIMHAAKPHPAYWIEIAQQLGRPAAECVMVGDEWELDIQPALSVGMQAFWIAGPEQAVAGQAALGQGGLSDLALWLRLLPDNGASKSG